MQEVMTDVTGVTTNHVTIDGPSGMNYGVQLNDEDQQCLLSEDFSESECLIEPSECPEGLTYSVWLRKTFTEETYSFDYSNFPIDKREYVMSTGGDDKGHPGFAMYLQGFQVCCVVSLGAEYWRECSFSGTLDNTWVNYGCAWIKPFTPEGKTRLQGGLTLYANATVIGGRRLGEVSTPKAKLDPPAVMLGCHKSATEPEYIGYHDCQYDEMAMWDRNIFTNESFLLMGGFDSAMDEISDDYLAEMADHIDTSNPDQYYMLLQKMMSSTSIPVLPTSGGAVAVSTPTEVNETTMEGEESGEEGHFPPPSAEGIKNMHNTYSMLKSMTRPNNMPDYNMDYHEYCMRVQVTKVFSNAFDPSNTNNWRRNQRDLDYGGSADVYQQLFSYIDEVMANTFFNDSNPMTCNLVTENILIYTQKLRVADQSERKSLVIAPNYRYAELTEERRNDYMMPGNRFEYPNDFVKDLGFECQKRAVNIKSMMCRACQNVMQSNRVNPITLNPNVKYKIDSHVIGFNMAIDEPYSEDDYGDCTLDSSVLKNNPLRFKISHMDKIIALRKPNFHEDEPVSHITVRTCAWWNEALSDFGGWDTEGCIVAETTDSYTKCVCEHFGLFAVLAELVPVVEVPDEAIWLMLVRYTGYALSGLALIFYIIVVARFKHLHEQFHLLGVNLSVAILIGSIMMVITDLDIIRDDRHICVAMGTLVHYFYAAAANWITMFGHAAFQAVTNGVVEGYLKAYMFISWGMAFVFVGFPFFFDIQLLGLDPRCMISWEDNPKMMFFGIQTVLSTLDTIFAMIVLCNLATPALRKDNLIDDYGSFCQGGAYVTLYFAFTWFIGLPAYTSVGSDLADFYPMFQVLNAYTGVMILIFIGFYSNRFNTVLTRKVYIHKRELYKNPFGTEDDKQSIRDNKILVTPRRPLRPSSVPKKKPLSASIAGRSRPTSN